MKSPQNPNPLLRPLKFSDLVAERAGLIMTEPPRTLRQYSQHILTLTDETKSWKKGPDTRRKKKGGRCKKKKEERMVLFRKPKIVPKSLWPERLTGG